jgi:hypothetical protein
MKKLILELILLANVVAFQEGEDQLPKVIETGIILLTVDTKNISMCFEKKVPD